MPLADFFKSPFTTVLQPEEVLIEVVVRRPAPANVTVFREVAPGAGARGLARVALACRLDPLAGTVAECRLRVGSTSHRLTGMERLVTGGLPDDELMSAAEATASAEVDPAGDIHASVAYRRRLTGVLVRRALGDVPASQEER